MAKILYYIGIISNLLMLLFLLILGIMLINETITGNTLYTNNQLLGFIIILYAIQRTFIRNGRPETNE